MVVYTQRGLHTEPIEQEDKNEKIQEQVQLDEIRNKTRTCTERSPSPNDDERKNNPKKDSQ